MKSNKPLSKAKVLNLPGIKFLNEVDSELRKVTWPSREKVTRLSLIVIVISIVIGLYLGALDFLFTNLMSYLVNLTN